MEREFKKAVERVCGYKNDSQSSDCQRVMDQEMSWVREHLEETSPQEPRRATRDYIQFLDTLSQESFVKVCLFSRYSLFCELSRTITSVFPGQDHPWIVEYASDSFSVGISIVLTTVVPSIPTEPFPVQCSIIACSSLDRSVGAAQIDCSRNDAIRVRDVQSDRFRPSSSNHRRIIHSNQFPETSKKVSQVTCRKKRSRIDRRSNHFSRRLFQ